MFDLVDDTDPEQTNNTADVDSLICTGTVYEEIIPCIKKIVNYCQFAT
jgi:hypothetical protein